jgi:hypothetical protein
LASFNRSFERSRLLVKVGPATVEEDQGALEKSETK